MVEISIQKNNKLENLLEIIYPSRFIPQKFASSDEYYKFLLDLKQKEAEVIKKFLKLSQNDILLDFGAGMGLITEHLHRSVKTTYCYEVDRNMLQYCKDKFQSHYNVKIIEKYTQIKPNKITANHVFSENFTFHEFVTCIESFHKIIQKNGLVWLDFFDEQQKNNYTAGAKMNFYNINSTLDALKLIGFKSKLVDSRDVHVKLLIQKL